MRPKLKSAGRAWWGPLLVGLGLLLGYIVPARSAPTVYPTGLTIATPAKTYAGYTISTDDSRPAKLVVLDMAGNVVHSWRGPLSDSRLARWGKPLSHGHILAYLVPKGESEENTMLVELDWEGSLVWSFDPQGSGHWLHHDFQRLKNGHTLILARKLRLVPRIAPREIWDDIILEVDRAGRIVWQWSTADHYDALGLSAEAKRLIYDASNADIFHTNSIQALPPNRHEASDRRLRAGNILVSQRNTNIVFLLEKTTGDIVYRFTDAIGQHHARMIPENLPGAGNILLFDNGGRAGYPPVFRTWSRVIEVDPVASVIIWEYPVQARRLGSVAFFSPFISSAQRLPNGNTLITEGNWARIFEVTQTGEIVWEYVWGNNTTAYRAYRIEDTWPTEPIGPFPW